jgi:hypothetical protein
MVLGRTLWTRGATSWTPESLEASSAPELGIIARLRDILSTGQSKRVILIFEPEGMAHEVVETPKVGRAVFSTLSRIRSRYPVVLSDNLGWGIEAPEPDSSGIYSTLLHSELVPGLVYLRGRREDKRTHLACAWSIYTASAACLRSFPGARDAKHVVVLLPGFSAISSHEITKRSCRTWPDTMTERDWRTLQGILCLGVTGSVTSQIGASRQSGVVVISEGSLDRLCPFWDDLRKSGRISAMLNLDDLSSAVRRIPRGSDANLAGSFPDPLRLDPILDATVVLFAAALLVLCALAFNERARYRQWRSEDQGRQALLERRLELLKANKTEVEALKKKAGAIAANISTNKYGALSDLTKVVPESLTLTSLELKRDGTFDIEALIESKEVDSETTRLALAKIGFVPSRNGWVFDSPLGVLRAHGRYTEPSP